MRIQSNLKFNRSDLGHVKAFLLCAGKAMRFHPHTLLKPKPLIPFLNIPLIAYNLYLLKFLGARQCGVNLHVHINLLKKSISQNTLKLKIEKPFFSIEEPELLGSAGGLLKLKNFLESENQTPFFYLNGDSFIWIKKNPEKLFQLYDSHIKSKALATFLANPTDKKTSVIWAGEKNFQIKSFLKKPIEENQTRAFDFSGLALFSPRIFKEIKPSDRHIFKDVLENPCLKPYLQVFPISDMEFLNMNDLNSYLKATGLVLRFLIEQEEKFCFLHQILSLFSPGWNTFRGENYFSATNIKPVLENKKDILFCGKKTKGLSKLQIKNFAVLGNNTYIQKPIKLSSSVVGPNMTLKLSHHHSLLL